MQRNTEIENERRKKSIYLVMRPELLKNVRKTSTNEGIELRKDRLISRKWIVFNV